jgi:hypothetical protein
MRYIALLAPSHWQMTPYIELFLLCGGRDATPSYHAFLQAAIIIAGSYDKNRLVRLMTGFQVNDDDRRAMAQILTRATDLVIKDFPSCADPIQHDDIDYAIANTILANTAVRDVIQR